MLSPKPPGSESLDDWWYARDPTHVSLYRDATFEWIAERWNASVDRPSRTVVLYRTGGVLDGGSAGSQEGSGP